MVLAARTQTCPILLEQHMPLQGLSTFSVLPSHPAARREASQCRNNLHPELSNTHRPNYELRE
jgi:hypothetical protein